ncbi:hypothetical protein [uncultured Maribacter sp.]|uniref:hypothetical protein n=1 Tax=uncultured Maribacter sp. TaxID=431308 RepID=UPI0030EBE483
MKPVIINNKSGIPNFLKSDKLNSLSFGSQLNIYSTLAMKVTDKVPPKLNGSQFSNVMDKTNKYRQ